MNRLSRPIIFITLLCFTIAAASARTWRDPKYGGFYTFGEHGVVTAKHPAREFSGKWWPTSKSSVKFEFYDDNGRTLGVNSLVMRTEGTAVVRMTGIASTFRWKLLEDRGGAGRNLDPATSGWFMEELRF